MDNQINEGQAEHAFWQFDARRKGYAEWRGAPQSERDAFKAEYRQAIAQRAAAPTPHVDRMDRISEEMEKRRIERATATTKCSGCDPAEGFCKVCRDTAPVSGDLPQQILTLPNEYKGDPNFRRAYTAGHTAARIQAADLARAAVSASQAAPAGGELPSIDTPEFRALEATYAKTFYAWEDGPGKTTGHAIADARKALLTHINGKIRAALAAAKVPTVDQVADVIERLIGSVVLDWFGGRIDDDDEPFSSDAHERAHLCEMIRLHGRIGEQAAAPVEQGQGAAIPQAVREGVEAAFERREGWGEKIAAAVRALGEQQGAGVMPEGARLTDDQIMDMAEPFHNINGVQFDEVAFARSLLAATPTAATAHPVAADDQVRAISDDRRFLAALDSYMDAVTHEPRNSDRRVKCRLEIFAAVDAALKSRTTAHGGAQGGA